MEKVKIEDAVGMPLCHDVTAMFPGFKGPLFKRGHVIEEKDIPVMLDIGKKTVYAGELAEGFLHEEDCAIRLSEKIMVEGAHLEGPSEGKMLLIADREGMFRVNTALLKKLNEIGDITIAALPDHYPVKPGARLASVRIVPLFTRREQIDQACEWMEKERLIGLFPYRERKTGVIITGSEIYHGRIQDRFEPVVRRKLSAYPGEILGVRICDDDRQMILEAAGELLAKGADFLIFTGGMSVDPDDLTPQAIQMLGADIICHGVPAQPGNMTLVAYREDIAILGVPGAAISLPTTIFDVLLPQIFTGFKLTKEDLTKLGDGGLCQMCKNCHFPNCTFGRY